jgi:hypothetical protein
MTNAVERKRAQRRREYMRHGQTVVAKAMPYLQVRVGDASVADDALSPVELAARRWKEDVIEDLGGAEHVSTAMMTLVDLASSAWVTWASLDHSKTTLAASGRMVNKRARRAYGIVGDCDRALGTLTKLLMAIGLERRDGSARARRSLRCWRRSPLRRRRRARRRPPARPRARTRTQHLPARRFSHSARTWLGGGGMSARHRRTRISPPEMTSTRAKNRRSVTSAIWRMPKADPTMPPSTAATASTKVLGGSDWMLEMCPKSPAIEFTKMKAEEIPAACRKLAHPMNSKSGLRKMPPPIPVRPDRKPRTAPDIMAVTR